VYLVPKSCIEWKSSHSSHNVFHRRIDVNVHDHVDIVIDIDKVFVNGTTEIVWTNKMQTWSSECVTISMEMGVVRVQVDKLLVFSVSRDQQTFEQGWHLELKFEFVQYLYFVELQSLKLEQEYYGVLWESGLLAALKWSAIAYKDGKE
jgi:hypothetical protein